MFYPMEVKSDFTEISYCTSGHITCNRQLFRAHKPFYIFFPNSLLYKTTALKELKCANLYKLIPSWKLLVPGHQLDNVLNKSPEER
jgi:hypothetical protein